MAFLRTAALLGLLTAIFLAVGFLLGGTYGMTIAFILAIMINFFSFWFSDKIVLSMYRAKPSDNRKLNALVEKVAKEAGIRKPRVYVVPSEAPNAFATGRSPSHSSVAFTQGILDRLDDEETEAVLAHEISHIKNRDTLVSTMAATIAGSISYLAQMAWYGNARDREGNSMIFLPLIILAPIGAMLVQLAISRGREFFADYSGAAITKKPLSLASALEKISSYAEKSPMKGSGAASHLWIVNPFKADAITGLFTTHPSTQERVRRLREMAKKI
jgi:heat shock protein HtpX